ncbi:hypothetical protein EH223_09115 [candidate division KSB1 bacterium]|nr:hypothetical protein [candidate division KSB1 bacterium]RQW03764.1 MAG: hypothetical protein EH223_09115 [candidate division KSB1 bacterium]
MAQKKVKSPTSSAAKKMTADLGDRPEPLELPPVDIHVEPGVPAILPHEHAEEAKEWSLLEQEIPQLSPAEVSKQETMVFGPSQREVTISIDASKTTTQVHIRIPLTYAN